MAGVREQSGYKKLDEQMLLAELADVSPQFREIAIKGLRGDLGKPPSEKPTQLARCTDNQVADAIALETEEAQAAVIGYMARLLVQVTMPHGKTKETFYERRNGNISISMLARPKIGLPFGTYPRLIMSWITTEAAKTKSPTLELGDSLSYFMSELGLTPTGGRWGTIPRLRDHMKRLFCSSVSWTHDGSDGWQNISVHPVEASNLWWDPRKPDQVGLWKSTLRLNQLFYEELIRHPVPLDMCVLKSLARLRSPMAIDIYAWLTYRMSYLRKQTVVPWASLSLQFGGAYRSLRSFKFYFSKWLRVVLELYPAAKVAPTDAGLRLQPSPTHVPQLH